jgi:transposase
VLININTPVSLKIEELTDLPKLRTFMEQNNLKLNKSEIARQLNVDRRTVTKYLEGFEKTKHRDKPSKLDSYYEIISELLNSETQVFHYRSILHRYLKDNYEFDVPAPTFYHYLKAVPEFDSYFNKTRISDDESNPVIRYETAPGEQAQLDWKESIPFILKDTGELIRINVLVLIMGKSRFRIFKPAIHMTQDVLVHLLTEIFESLGGVPKTILTDNMKTIMDVARTQYRTGKVNEKFEAFAKDFGFQIVPCKAATPKTKGKVESQMKLLDEICAYSGKMDLVELHELINRINQRANNSICKGTGKIPMLEFEEEKDSLLPLPHESVRNQYRIKTVSVKVNSAAMITIKTNQYSVPKEYIGKMVEYQIYDSNIYVYFNTKLIATHVLSNKKLNYSVDHYVDALACKYIGKSSDEVRELAKHNLEIIGGIYE